MSNSNNTNNSSIWGMFKQTFQEYGEDKIPRLSAALAYYTMLSLAPLLVIVIAALTFIMGSNSGIRNQIVTMASTSISPSAGDLINQVISNAQQSSGNVWATIIGSLTLLIGATTVFAQLQDGMDTVWDVRPKPGRGIGEVIHDRLLSFLLILGISLVVLLALILSTILNSANSLFGGTFIGSNLVWQIINFVVNTGIMTLVFALVFKILPDVKIQWSVVWVGAFITAVLFMIGNILVGLYLNFSATASIYGTAGALVAILIWVYFTAQIFFIGAEFTQVYARQQGEGLEPTENAEWISPEARESRPTAAQPTHRPGTSRRETGQPASRQVPPAPIPSGTVLIPVAGQPEVEQTIREVVRYAPPNPESVVPFIALGTVAGIATVAKLIAQVTQRSSR